MAVTLDEVPQSTKIRAVVCGMIVNLMIGSYYNYSNMNIYVSNYLRTFNPSLNPAGKDTAVIMPIWLMTQSVVAIFSVRVADRIGFYSLNYLAFSWFCLNQVLMIFVKSYWAFVLVYGFSNGVAIGLGYLPSLYVAWTYYPEKRSVVTGVILFCAGISASITSPITTYIVNPKNLDPNSQEVSEKVPFLFLCISIGYGCLTLLGCTFQPDPFKSEQAKEVDELSSKLAKNIPEVEKQEIRDRIKTIRGDEGYPGLTDKDIAVYQNEQFAKGNMQGSDALLMGILNTRAIGDMLENVQKSRRNTAFNDLPDRESVEVMLNHEKHFAVTKEEIYQKSKELQDLQCPSVYHALTSTTFLFLGVMSFCISIYNYFLLVSWKDIYKFYLHLDDNKLSFVLSTGAFANSSLRIIVGILLLKFSFKTFYLLNISIIVCSAFTCISSLSQINSYEIGLVYIFAAFAGLGTQVTIFPTICTKVFGSFIGPKVYPCIYFCFSCSNLTAYMIYKYLDNKELMFYIFGGFGLLGMLMGIFFDPNPSWAKAIHEYKINEQRIKEAKEGGYSDSSSSGFSGKD